MRRPLARAALSLALLALSACVPAALLPRPADPPRAGIQSPVTIGGVSVTVAEVDVRPDETLISVTVAVADRAKAVTFRPWQADSGGGAASLRDEHGNVYLPLRRPAALPDVLSVRADRPGADVLAFDAPVPAAKYLELDLAGENVGVDGTFRFSLPVKRKPTEKPAEKARPKR